ncbi:hypothetical protein E1B28_010628 [Marasmius oreades]|uniref:GST N-terminal domain-containing protein n=1 Tax=Marasmius oreades TaxID=181124 RepID=A0A9P7UTV2_9AGAR|nr:uncharacterized protein E1B28_010628 [Marasmius oreades]KAG7091609.1 hypothetical protein E1B28_010628 [Marasmius oreades]
MSAATEIQFYDIPSKTKSNAWSPNTWRIRYALNYKRLPYKTIWIEYPEIAPTCKKIGAPPSATKPDGSPYYSVPFIYDPKTRKAISDSIIIIQYLEKTYPSSPERSLIPSGTWALQLAFIDALFAPSVVFPLFQFAVPRSASMLHETSVEHYLEARRELFGGRTLAEVDPKGEDRVLEWKKVEKGFGVVNSWLKPEDRFVGGEQIIFVDFVLVSVLRWIREIWGEDSSEWRDVSSWNEGRWGNLVKDLEEYTTVL